MDSVTVSGDRGQLDPAEAVFDPVALMDAARAAHSGLPPGEPGVLDAEGDVADPVSVAVNVVGDAAVGAQGGGQNEANAALLQDIGGAVVQTGFRPRPGDESHAKGGAIVVGGLAGIANVELKVIRTGYRQEVLLSLD